MDDEIILYTSFCIFILLMLQMDAESLYVAGIHSLKDSDELLFLVGSNKRKG